jgi:hypothetical protein
MRANLTLAALNPTPRTRYVEFVGTAPAYRRRGLVRRQFELAYRRSLDEGCLVQAVAGINWYYRQFGYDYALERTRRGRMLAPLQGDGGHGPAGLASRPATVGDVLFPERPAAGIGAGPGRSVLGCEPPGAAIGPCWRWSG